MSSFVKVPLNSERDERKTDTAADASVPILSRNQSCYTEYGEGPRESD